MNHIGIFSQVFMKFFFWIGDKLVFFLVIYDSDATFLYIIILIIINFSESNQGVFDLVSNSIYLFQC